VAEIKTYSDITAKMIQSFINDGKLTREEVSVQKGFDQKIVDRWKKLFYLICG